MIYTERYQCDSFPKVIGVETHWQQTCRSDTPRALPEFSDVLLVKAMDLWLTGYGNYGNRTSRSLNNGAFPKSSTLSMSISVVLWILLFWKRICRYIFFLEMLKAHFQVQSACKSSNLPWRCSAGLILRSVGAEPVSWDVHDYSTWVLSVPLLRLCQGSAVTDAIGC